MALSVDEYLEYAGVMGPYQWRLIVMIGVMMAPMSMLTFVTAFLDLEPNWKCVNGSTICNFTQTFSMFGSDPKRTFRCDIPRKDWEFTTSFTSIVTEWDLVCDNSHLAWATASIMYAGWVLGTFFFGALSDKYGRKKILFISSCMVTWLSFISSFIPYYWLYVIFRFFIGFGLGGSIVCLFVMATEFVGPVKRGLAGAFTWYFWAGSLMVLAFLAYIIRDWRTLSIATSAPGLLLFLFWFFIPESVRWMFTHNKEKEAQLILEKIGKFNKKKIPEGLILGLSEGQNSHGNRKANLLDLFSTRSMTKKTVILWISWFVVGQVYYGVTLGSVLLGGNVYLNFFLTSFAELAGTTISIWSMNKFGRKLPVVVGLVVASIASMLVTVFPNDPENSGFVAGQIIFALFGKFANICSYDSIYVFSSELFPTVIRNVGVGSSEGAAQVGAMTAPLVLWLGRYFTQLPYIIIAIDSLIAGCLCFLLPETNKEPTIEILSSCNSGERLVELQQDAKEFK